MDIPTWLKLFGLFSLPLVTARIGLFYVGLWYHRPPNTFLVDWPYRLGWVLIITAIASAAALTAFIGLGCL